MGYAIAYRSRTGNAKKVANEAFFCKGKLFVVFNAGHPNARDLVNAGEFALRAVKP